jgi:hypothetical protein
MQKMIIISLAALLFCNAAKAPQCSLKAKQKKEVSIQFNPNVELLGLIYFIGYLGPEIEPEAIQMESNGNPIYEKDWYAYGYHLYNKYLPYRESENLATLHKIAGDLDASYLIGLILQLDHFPHASFPIGLAEEHFIQLSPTHHVEEAKTKTVKVINALNEFYREVTFDAYLSSSKPLYEHAMNQVKEHLPADPYIPAMEAFYQKQFHEYKLIPSLTIPTGMGFAPRYNKHGKTHIFNVFGPLGVQKFHDRSQPDMGFGDEKRLRELSVHEFGHSFVNPVLDKIPDSLISQTEHLFEPIAAAMSEQSYPTWRYCLNEHFVRAGEVMISRKLGKLDEADHLQSHYVHERQFIYLPLILEELEQYAKKQDKTYEEVVKVCLRKLKDLDQD